MAVRTIPAASVIIALEDVILDQICFEQLLAVVGDRREAGRIKGYVEATFEANPGLADVGTILPLGLRIELPQFSIETEDRTTLRLWDY